MIVSWWKIMCYSGPLSSWKIFVRIIKTRPVLLKCHLKEWSPCVGDSILGTSRREGNQEYHQLGAVVIVQNSCGIIHLSLEMRKNLCYTVICCSQPAVKRPNSWPWTSTFCVQSGKAIWSWVAVLSRVGDCCSFVGLWMGLLSEIKYYFVVAASKPVYLHENETDFTLKAWLTLSIDCTQ